MKQRRSNGLDRRRYSGGECPECHLKIHASYFMDVGRTDRRTDLEKREQFNDAADAAGYTHYHDGRIAFHAGMRNWRESR